MSESGAFNLYLIINVAYIVGTLGCWIGPFPLFDALTGSHAQLWSPDHLYVGFRGDGRLAVAGRSPWFRQLCASDFGYWCDHGGHQFHFQRVTRTTVLVTANPR